MVLPLWYSSGQAIWRHKNTCCFVSGIFRDSSARSCCSYPFCTHHTIHIIDTIILTDIISKDDIIPPTINLNLHKNHFRIIYVVPPAQYEFAMSILCSLSSLDMISSNIGWLIDCCVGYSIHHLVLIQYFFCTIAHIIHDDMTVYTSLFATALPYTVDGLS